jgi:hypothetical protein
VETGKDPTLRLELFGKVVEIAPAVHVPYLRFLLRPHVVEHGGPPPALYVDFAPALGEKHRDAAAERAGTPEPLTRLPLSPAPEISPSDVLVRGGNPALASRSTFGGWGNVPPQVPPIAAWPDRLAVLQAVVLARGDAAVALIGSPDSAKVGVAIALARRGWRFVSGSLLVIDRAHGWALPCHTPLEARGAALAALHEAGAPRGMCQTTVSPVSGEMLQVRPEALGPLVPIRSKLPRPALIRLCQRNDPAALEPWEFRASVWPADAGAELAELPTYRLSVPETGSAAEAAELIDGALPAERKQMQEDECRAVPSTPPVLRAGSTELLLT